MTRNFRALPCLIRIRFIPARLRLLCRMRAQTVVIAEPKLLDPCRRGMAALTTQGATASRHVGVHDTRGRQSFAAVPAVGTDRAHGEIGGTSGACTGLRVAGILKLASLSATTGGGS